MFHRPSKYPVQVTNVAASTNAFATGYAATNARFATPRAPPSAFLAATTAAAFASAPSRTPISSAFESNTRGARRRASK